MANIGKPPYSTVNINTGRESPTFSHPRWNSKPVATHHFDAAMYTRYFGLTEKPFAIAPNPRYLYMSGLHREALAHLIYGIGSDGCIILLTGDVGTGKTTVCRCLLDQLPETTDVALVLNPKLSIEDLLRTICEELDIVIDRQESSVKTFIDKLNTHLLEAHARGRNTALIIDEAQNLDIEVMEQLRLLTNLETDTHKLLQIVLIGQPELQKILANPQLSQINQRITTRYHLRPLDREVIDSYIEHRLTIAGHPGHQSLFTKGARKQVARLSRGIPRVINILCDRALLGAYAENRSTVTARIVKRAASEILPPGEHRKRWIARKGVLVTICLLAVTLPVGYYLYRQLVPDTRQPEVLTSLFRPSQSLEQTPSPPLQEGVTTESVASGEATKVGEPPAAPAE